MVRRLERWPGGQEAAEMAQWLGGWRDGPVVRRLERWPSGQEAGEVARWIRALAAVGEDLSSVSPWCSKWSLTPGPEDLVSLSRLHGHQPHMWYAHRNDSTHAYT